MNTHQKKTFLVYSRGLAASNLILGGLYLDPANPLDDERKRMDCPLRSEEMQDWLSYPEDEQPCTLRFTASSDWLIRAGVMDIVLLQTGRARSQEVTVLAESGRRLFIKRPETFLNQVILSIPTAAAWLASVLSISRSMYYLNKVQIGRGRHPRIWMLTGIQYLSNAEVTSSGRRSSDHTVSASIPPPGPMAAAASILTRLSMLSVDFSIHRSSETSMLYRHSDERIWAAQFTPLDVKFHPSGENGANLPPWISLGTLPDLKDAGMRGDEQTVEVHDEIAEVVGLDWTDGQQWDEDPASMLEAMEDVDWSTLHNYLDLSGDDKGDA